MRKNHTKYSSVSKSNPSVIKSMPVSKLANTFTSSLIERCVQEAGGGPDSEI